MSARPIATIACCPPDSSYAGSELFSRIAGNTSKTRSRAAARSFRRAGRVWMTFSSFGVSVPTSLRNSGSSSC